MSVPSGDAEVEAVARVRLTALSEEAPTRPERAGGACDPQEVSAS